MTGFHLTLCTSLQEQPAGKRYSLSPQGTLTKQVDGRRLRYRATRLVVPSVAALAEQIQALRPQHYLGGGTYEQADVIAVTARERLRQEMQGVHRAPDGTPYATFSKADLRWNAGAGVLVIDADGYDRTTARAVLLQVVPEAASWPMLAMSSSGAHVYDLHDLVLRAETGSHLLIPVDNAQDVPRALLDLHRRMWLAGHGSVKLSHAGSFLVRSPVDLALRNSTQPVFLYSLMGEGLQQRKQIEVFNADAAPVITTQAIHPLTLQETGTYAAMVAAAKRDLLPQAVAQQREYIHEYGQRIVEQAAAEGRAVSLTAAMAQAAGSLTEGILRSDFPLRTANGVVTVSQVLAEPQRWNGTPVADPMEPDYGSGVGVAKIFAKAGSVRVHSFAHGGRTYRLADAMLGHEAFDLDAWASRTCQEEGAAIARAAGDVARLEALTGPALKKGEVLGPVSGDSSASPQDLETLARHVFLHCVGVARSDEHLPAGLAALQDELLFGVEVQSSPASTGHQQVVRLVLPLSQVHQALNTWIEREPEQALERWPDLVARATGLTAEAAGIDKVVDHVRRVVKQKVDSVRGKLLGAIRDHQAALQAAVLAATPQLDDELQVAEDPDEVAAQAERARLARQRVLLAQAGDIPEDPIPALKEAARRLGVVGEEQAVVLAFLIMLSAALPKPTSGVLRGQPGTGKSHVMLAVAKLFPPERVYVASSLSPKAVIYEPRSFAHSTIVLLEAEALRRDKGDEENGLAEMIRVLLSEGFLLHKTVEKQDGSLVTITRQVDGPTNLLTSTTRPRLDPELETRLLDHWSDTTEDHAQAVLLGLAQRAQGMAGPRVDLEHWHAFVEWVHAGATSVVIPFASILAREFRLEGSRRYRDFNAMLTLITVVALMHRTARQVDGQGQVVADLDDYRVVHEILSDRFGELSGRQVPAELKPVFVKVRRVIEERGQSPYGPSTAPRRLQISLRRLVKLTGVTKSTLERGLGRLEKLDMLTIERDPLRPTASPTYSIAPDAPEILADSIPVIPSPERVQALLASALRGEVLPPEEPTLATMHAAEPPEWT